MQHMGCGSADVIHLCGFLSLSGSSIQYHIRRIEEVMGPVQISARESSERDSIMEEIEAKKINDSDGLKYHGCTIDEHKHPPLPMVKGSYGEK